MHTGITYKGTLNGVHGLWCGFCPEGVEVKEEITVYYPDDGNVFIKNGEEYPCVVLKNGESIENYVEKESIDELEE